MPNETTEYNINLEYCIPEFFIGCDYGDMIDNFILYGDNGSVISDIATGCSDNFYRDRTDLTVDLHQGYSYIAKVVSATNFNHSAIWIDFNDDGVFDPSEKVAGQILDHSNDVEISIAEDATIGSHRMRVMVGWDGNPNDLADLDPCNTGENSTMYGEVHDYTVDIFETLPCGGTPNSGQIDSESSFSICEGTPLILRTIGATQAIGITYQWQHIKPENDNIWTNIEGANRLTLKLNDGISELTEFRLVTTCEISGMTDISNKVTITIKPESECYCIPTYSYTCSSMDQINSVFLEGESVTLHNESDCSIENYGDFTDLNAPDLLQGSSYTLSVSTEYIGPLVENVRVWIDYDKNGVFDDSEEIANTNGNGMGEQGVVHFDFTIPQSVEPSEYRMRIKLVHEGDSNISPCANEEFGETEDYTVEILENLNIEEYPFNRFAFYPNPTKELLNIKSNNIIQNIKLFDILGKEHLNRTANSTSYQINTSELQPGVYFMKVTIHQKEKTYKFIKK